MSAIDSNVIQKLHTAMKRQDPKYGVMFLIGVDTGLRVSDILALKVGDVMKGKTVKKQITVIEKKTQKPRTVCITDNTAKEIKQYVSSCGLAMHEPLIRGKRKDGSLGRAQAWRVMSRLSHSLGLKNVGSHSMRKTYAKNKYALNGSINALKNDFNHTDIKTTLAYLVEQDKIAAILDEILMRT